MTKTRRLPEIDLARLVAITDQQILEQAVDLFDAGGGIWSYDPVRASTADLLGASTPLFGPIERAPWADLERQIRAASFMDIQARANALVGKVLYDESIKRSWMASKFIMGSVSVGHKESVRYWSDVVVAADGDPLVAFFDYRREQGATNPAVRRVIFSMQNVGVRDRYPDLANAKLAVVRFPSIGAARAMTVDVCDETGLLSYEELNARVANVYRTWAAAAERRKGKKTAVGGAGPLFGT